MDEQIKVKREVGDEGTRPGRAYRPDVDIWETDEALWVSADLPGVDEKSLEVRVEDGRLSIEGRVSLEEYETLSPVYTEHNVGDFVRSFRISDAFDAEGIRAKLVDGVLSLELPKAARVRAREIPIQSG